MQFAYCTLLQVVIAYNLHSVAILYACMSRLFSYNPTRSERKEKKTCLVSSPISNIKTSATA
ncbi:CLUMA_CG019803, isoform A [Clunio marinus]|uniref:CLUMA_CG019803, isoform A n=1 Tax=Clunio marinus TaxID=568069 RepID=A0A1J1J2N2_9DIPT|nr:CLUMA_CG019803, isoform A [Clunio marinus]